MTDTAVYVYGIVPADVEVEDGVQGVGDPPASVEVIREGEVAALVSKVSTDQPLGAPHDLEAHARLLDGTAAVSPVIPLRFGAAMTDADSVTQELLRKHHDEFAKVLKALEGHAEFVLKGRYDSEKFLVGLLTHDNRARDLRDEIRDKPDKTTRNARMELGELIAHHLDAARQADTAFAIDELNAIADQLDRRESTHEWDAVNVAVLAEVSRQPDLEDVVERLRSRSEGVIEFRLLGPLAPYDFVVTQQGAE